MAKIKGYRNNRLYSSSRRSFRTRLLFQALKEGNVPMTKLLLKEGGLQIKARLVDTKKSLLQAAVYYESSMAIIRRLVRAGCRVNGVDCWGDTALTTAVRYHRIDVACYLIKLGANVRVKNIYGETPLQLAVLNKSHVDVLREMIPNGEHYQVINFYGLYSLHLATAAWWQRDDLVQKLSASHQGETIYGAKLHRLIKMLLDAGADINARDVDGCSPLHCAVYTGDVELVKALIDAGADLDNRNDLGATALHEAVLCCNEAMVFLLLSRGARVDIEIEDKGDTALHWATRFNIDNSHVAVIRKLMAFGSDLNYENANGETPFKYILQYSDFELVSLSIDEYEADLRRLQLDGSNALASAAQNEDERVMHWVLESGIDVNHRCTEQGLTPLHHASAMSLLGNVRRLISRGADVNTKDYMLDRTPLFECIFQLKLHEASHASNIPLVLFRNNYAEERRRVMRLLLESGADVNNLAVTFIHKKQTVLELAFELDDIEAWSLIIEYAVEVEARTRVPMFDEHNLRVIEDNAELNSYYQECRAELATMSTTKIAESSFVTYLSVLTEQLDVVARYTKNDELVENFESKLQSFPIYQQTMKEKFIASIIRQMKMNEVLKVLSTMLQFTDPTNIILEKIFEYLPEEDTTKLFVCF